MYVLFTMLYKRKCVGKTQKITENGSKVKYENWHKKLQVPFVIYADFESITENVANQMAKVHAQLCIKNAHAALMVINWSVVMMIHTVSQ